MAHPRPLDAEGSKPSLDDGGYTMLPLRGVVEAMGGSLSWDATNRVVTMVKSGQTVKVPIGSTKLTVDGVQKDMLANNGTYKAAYINKSGRTLVHVRALQAFNTRPVPEPVHQAGHRHLPDQHPDGHLQELPRGPHQQDRPGHQRPVLRPVGHLQLQPGMC